MIHVLVDKIYIYQYRHSSMWHGDVFIRIKHFTHYLDDECFPVILDFLDDRVTHHVKNMLFAGGN